MTETWKPIPGYEGLYEVSDRGRVRRIHYTLVMPRVRISTEDSPRTILREQVLKRGYRRVVLSGGVPHRKKWQIHQLVARAFIGERPHGYVINHRDGNPANNRPDNLEYTTQQENIRHAFRVLKRPPHHRGETTHFSKLSDNDVIQIRRLRSEGQTYKQISARFNTKPANVWHICVGHTWKHLL